MADGRTEELSARLAAVRDRIAAAAAAVGRDPAGITLIAITKTYPVEDVRRLRDLGVGDVGENRDQEAAPKAASVPDLRWHFVGQLQRNKARSVAGYAACVHSVDSVRLATALATAMETAVPADRVLDVFVQVSLDGDPDRGGVPPEGVAAVTDHVAGRSDRLRLLGLMGVPPLGSDPAAGYARLAELAERVRARHPGADRLSAGMSGDLEAAVAAGATHVRIGTALLGDRPPHLG